MKKREKSKETILVFGAHTDDFVIGAGGTIANYIEDGKKVIGIIFSYGEMSHPWMKGKIVQKFRKEEALEASKILGCISIILDLKEGKFYDGYKANNYEKILLDMINKSKPTKIFTHSGEDPHPDHKAIHKITLELYEKLKFKPELYIYSIWNPVSFKTDLPSLYVNIRKNFSLKMKALKSFKSQQIHISYPIFLLIFRAIKNGFKIKTTFAEKFYRIR